MNLYLISKIHFLMVREHLLDETLYYCIAQIPEMHIYITTEDKLQNNALKTVRFSEGDIVISNPGYII